MITRLSYSLLCAVIAVSAASLTPRIADANAPQAWGIAASGQLAQRPNTVLLAYLTDACLDGALQLGPAIAGNIFTEIWDAPYPDFGINLAALAGQGKEIQPFPAIQAVAARALGRLAGTGELPAPQYEAVICELIGLAETRKGIGKTNALFT